MQFNQPYNRNDFLNFLRINFLPEDFKQEETSVANPVQFQYTQKVTRLGECESLGLVVYEVKHSSKHDARVGLTKEAFRLLADEFCERALIFFVPEDDNGNYRFSLIEITLEQKADSARVGRKYSNPHRYSYYLGKGISYYTPNKYLNEYGRVMSVEDLRNRFSVEVLTKAFYQELSDWYAWAIMVVRFPNDLKTLEDNQKYNAEAMIRLITRLIFVWFIKQRHLVPDEFFDEKYIANNLIKGFTPNAKVTLFGKSEESHYYKGILQNLFFAMLNSPITPEGKDTISERRFRNGRSDYDNNKLMRHEDLFINPQKFVELANQYVPFLNGGLFDCLDDKDNGVYIDAFTDREVIARQLIVPDYLFFGEDVGRNIDLSEWYGDAKKKKVSARGIIDILKRYNFTVEENTPFDQEVSLDPELLGKVFENLLASYNPETQTTARKQTGSFYTPREIVQYMVDESLVAHLKRTVGDDLEPEFRKLIQYTDETPDLTAEQKRQIMMALYDCKVLDPACGSGAFPMGMLQQMVHILNRIDPDNTMWKEVMLNNAISETSEVYQNASDEERAEMVADIERNFNESINRPDYARKLYLIENCIYGVDIQPIAIQISKLRFFISLVVDQKTNNSPVDNFGIRPLPNLEAKFVAANTLIGLEKKEANLFDSDAIREKEKALKEAKHRIFGAKTVKTKRKYKERVATLRTEIADMLKESGSIGNEEAQQLAQWDMFDQNATSPFFDPEWMFGVGDGFDVVIGNPPWGADLSKKDKESLKTFYKEIDSSTPNSFAYFIGWAYRNNKHVVSFVLPDSLLIKDYAKTRKLIIPSISHVIWYQNSGVPYELKPFKYVDHDVCVVIFCSKNSSKAYFETNYYNNKRIDRNGRVLEKARIIREEFEYAINLIVTEKDLHVLDKLSQHTPISRFMQCHEGIHTGNIRDKLFIKGGEGNLKPLFYGGGAGDIINTYYSIRSGWLVDYRKEIIDKSKGEYASLRDEKIFMYPKIYITRTGNPFKAFYDEDSYASNNFFSLQMIDLSKNSFDNLLFVLAFINSKVCQYFIRVFAAPRLGSTFVETKIFHLLKYPIPEIADNNNETIVKKVTKIISTKMSNPKADTRELEDEVNFLVYKLYGLSYDEVLVVDPETIITREEYYNN